MGVQGLQMGIAKKVKFVKLNDRIKLLIYFKNLKLKNILFKIDPYQRTDENVPPRMYFSY